MRILNAARTLFGRIFGRPATIKDASAAIARMASDWGRTYDVQLVLGGQPRQPYKVLRNRTEAPGPQPTNTQVLGFLAAGGRDLLEVTPAMRAQIIRSVAHESQRYQPGTIPSQSTVQMAIALAYKDAVIKIAETGQGLRPNSAEWLNRKRQLGYALTPARASSQLLNALKRANIRIVPR